MIEREEKHRIALDAPKAASLSLTMHSRTCLHCPRRPIREVGQLGQAGFPAYCFPYGPAEAWCAATHLCVRSVCREGSSAGRWGRPTTSSGNRSFLRSEEPKNIYSQQTIPVDCRDQSGKEVPKKDLHSCPQGYFLLSPGTESITVDSFWGWSDSQVRPTM